MIGLSSCVELYEPDVQDYESTLVVDALFSDSDSASLVTLSRSFGYNEDEILFISDAVVTIEDDGGGSTLLAEKSPGRYYTDPASYKGEVGKQYRLRIQTADGNQFESDWQLLKPSVPIESITFEQTEVIPDDPRLNPIKGVEFFVSSEDPTGQTRFYRWEWLETYIYNNNPPFFIVDFEGAPPRVNATFSEVPSEDFAGLNCWKTLPSSEILIASTDNLQNDRVESYKLNFVDNTTPRLYARYSLLVKQYSISQDYYRFLEKVEQFNETTGSLFDPIPNEIIGNIKSSSDQNIPVLGYFGVGGVSEGRIFIERNQLEAISAPSGPFCRQDTVDVGDFQGLYYRVELTDRIFHNYLFDPVFPGILGYLITSAPCAFCEDNGATNIQPDFW